MTWLYNLWVPLHNDYVSAYNRLTDEWNQEATEEPEDAIIPTELYNQQVEEYNWHVDQWNKEERPV